MPGDLLSRRLIEIARDLREKRATARELIEAAIARHDRATRNRARRDLARQGQCILFRRRYRC